MARPKAQLGRSAAPRSGRGAAGGEDAAVAGVADIVTRASGGPPPGEVWIGDDAALVAEGDGPLLLATDAAVEHVHADLSLVSLADLGWKAFTATVSDIGAMGGRPRHALLTFCVPPGTDLDQLATGVAEASAAWACPVVGGDVTASSEIVVSVAATGTLEGPEPPVLRSGAAAGDTLFVTGPLGASAAGLRALRARRDGSGGARHDAHPEVERLVAAHRRPRARLDEGATARGAGAGAMIDVSDGLALDLHRLAEASGVGFELRDVPASPGATEEDALGGGEDYELVVATGDPGRLRAAFAAAGLREPLEIGRCLSDPSRRELRGRPLARTGYEHALG